MYKKKETSKEDLGRKVSKERYIEEKKKIRENGEKTKKKKEKEKEELKKLRREAEV